MTFQEVLDRYAIPDGRIVFLTGAGVSVASGLPTYTDPDGTRSEETFDPDSEKYQEIIKAQFAKVAQADPNAAHFAPGKLLERGFDVYVITQNVDGLYQKAGFPEERLFEIHGNWERGDVDLCCAIHEDCRT